MSSKHQRVDGSSDGDILRKGSKRRKLMLTPPSDNGCKSLHRSPLTRYALKELERTTAHIVTPPSSIDSLKAVDVDPKQLRLIAIQGGPDLGELRGYSNSLDEVNADMPQASENTSKASSAYRADYEMRLVDSLICPASENYNRAAIANIEDIEAEMVRDLGVLSPLIEINKDHKAQFKIKSDRSKTECDWMRDAFPYIAGEVVIPHASEVAFNNLAPITEKKLTKAKPDYYEGSSPLDLKEKIREQLGKYITPSTHLERPILPNFFLEAKSRRGNGAVAELQACHDGALGARGIHRLRSYGKNPNVMYDNNAYTISATYCNNTLTMYAHHPTSSIGYGTPEQVAKLPTAYHMTLIGAWSMVGDLESYRKGITAFRNLSAWAKMKRYEVIAAASEVSELAVPEPQSGRLHDHGHMPDGEQDSELDDPESEEEGDNESEEEADNGSEEEDDEELEEEADEELEEDDDKEQDKDFRPSSSKKRTNLHQSRDIPSAKRRHSSTNPDEPRVSSDPDDQDFDELGHTPPRTVGKRARHG